MPGFQVPEGKPRQMGSQGNTRSLPQELSLAPPLPSTPLQLHTPSSKPQVRQQKKAPQIPDKERIHSPWHWSLILFRVLLYFT